jgi:hypothetical protein
MDSGDLPPGHPQLAQRLSAELLNGDLLNRDGNVDIG